MTPAEIKEQWEEIGNNTYRLPVPGGWLIQTSLISISCSTQIPTREISAVTVHQIFIADENYEWSGSRGLPV